MSDHVFTVPVLVHVRADSAEEAIRKFDRVSDAGPGVIEINGQRLPIIYLNAPIEVGDGFTGTDHSYDLSDLLAKELPE